MRATDFEKKVQGWIECGAITDDAQSLGEGPHLDLICAPYVLYGVEYIDPVSLVEPPALFSGGENMPREIKRAHVTLIKPIGSGAFGDVFVGKLDESSLHNGVPSYLVAIKTVKADGTEEGIDDLLKEVRCLV